MISLAWGRRYRYFLFQNNIFYSSSYSILFIQTLPFVGAGLLAMNDNVVYLKTPRRPNRQQAGSYRSSDARVIQQALERRQFLRGTAADKLLDQGQRR